MTTKSRSNQLPHTSSPSTRARAVAATPAPVLLMTRLPGSMGPAESREAMGQGEDQWWLIFLFSVQIAQSHKPKSMYLVYLVHSVIHTAKQNILSLMLGPKNSSQDVRGFHPGAVAGIPKKPSKMPFTIIMKISIST